MSFQSMAATTKHQKAFDASLSLPWTMLSAGTWCQPGRGVSRDVVSAGAWCQLGRGVSRDCVGRVGGGCRRLKIASTL